MESVILQHKMNRSDGKWPVSLVKKDEWESKKACDVFTIALCDTEREQDAFAVSLNDFTGYEIFGQDLMLGTKWTKRNLEPIVATIVISF